MKSKQKKIDEVLSKLDKIELGHKIVKNAAQCKLCKAVIESKSVHDYVSCKCRAIAVDGGHEYVKRVGEFDNMIELSVYEDCYHDCEHEKSELYPNIYWCTACGMKLEK